MTLLPVWTETTSVKPYETDFRGLWKPHCFFQTFQQAATCHAEHLGVGYHAMLSQGIAWLLARLKLKIYRLPSLDEPLTLQTWPRGLQQKIFFMRDFRMLDAAGETIAAATSAWLLVDLEKRSLVRPDVSMLERLPANPGRLAQDEQIDRITLPDNMEECFTVNASYSTVDLIGHVNNARYVEWAADCFPLDWYRDRQLDTLQINYAGEVKPGEQVSVRAAQQDDITWLVAGENLSNGTRAFEMVWTWK